MEAADMAEENGHGGQQAAGAAAGRSTRRELISESEPAGRGESPHALPARRRLLRGAAAVGLVAGVVAAEQIARPVPAQAGTDDDAGWGGGQHLYVVNTTATVSRPGRLTLSPFHATEATMTTKTRLRGATARMLPQARSWQAALLAILGLAACSTAGGTASNGPATASAAKPTVTSTLDGHTTLPHRIHWQAFPGVPSVDVSEVDYLIDGKQMWVEHKAPYYYGSDGNYLVTSFLTPGTHVFTVRAIDVRGPVATDTVTATVPQAPSPPAALAGTWKARQPAGGPPAGYWSLVISSVGWYEGQFPVTDSNGNLEDVAYLSPGLVEIRTGMATGHDRVSGAASDNDLNGWCNNDPGSPARYRWSVTGTRLRLTFAGGHPCPGFTKLLTASWTRARR